MRRGCFFWVLIVFAAALALAVAAIVSPPVLVFGVVVAALVVINPGQVGDGIRAWPIWQRVPLLGTRGTAAGFAAVLLLYAVPVPGLLTYALVAGQSGGATQSSDTSKPTPQVAQAQPDATPTATPPPSPTPTPAPTPTATPTPAPTAPPVAVRTPVPPPPAPASACSASVKFPTPGDGGEQTVYVSSNVPNSPVTIVVHYKTTVHTFAAGTDGGGNSSDTFSIGRPTIGYPVAVDVTVGAAQCATSFTPQ